MLHSHRRRTPIDHVFAVDGLLSLEPRLVLTAYTLLDNEDAFGLNDFVRSVVAPEADGAENFGYNVAALGDINADGRPDFAVAAPGRLPDPIGRWGGVAGDEGPIGRVYLFSGGDLSLIRTLTNNFRGFGAAIANVGDMDADGVPDLVVGSPNFDNNADLAIDHHGRITVYSGATGGIIRNIDGAGRFFELGYSLANVGDFDGDGHDDVIVGAPGAGMDPAAEGPGCAFVYSLIDGVLLHAFTGENLGDRFGHAVAGGADLNIALGSGDDVTDFVVGAPGYDGSGPDSGRAYAFNGQTGAQLTNSPLGDNAPPAQDGIIAGDIDPQPGDRFGSSVAIIGAGGDAQSTAFLLRILVGAPGADSVAFQPGDSVADRGIVYAYSLGSGGVIVDVNLAPRLDVPAEDDRFGERIFLLGDFAQGDGVSEIAILAPGNITGHRLTIANGNYTNFSATGVSNAGRYSSAAVVGDLDADGINDFVFGEALDDDRHSTAVRAMVVPFTIATGSLLVGPVSDDGNYVVMTSSLGSVDGSNQVGYVIVNGTPRTLREMGLEGLTVRGVNNVGLFFADRTSIPGGGGFLLEQFIVYNGQRTPLAGAYFDTIGPAPTGDLQFQSMNNVGDMVFLAPNGAYLLRGGRLIFLWSGGVGHVNDAGVVVGVGPRDGPASPTPDIIPTGLVRTRNAAGLTTDIPGLRTTGVGQFIDNRGRIYGQDESGALLMWDNGDFTELANFSTLGLTGTFFNWTINDVDETGKISATVHYAVPFTGRPPSSSPSANYLFEPGAGLRGTGLVIVNPLGIPLPPPSGSGAVISKFITGNAILVDGNLAVPQPRAGAADTAINHPINVTWTTRGLDVAVSATSGQALILRLTGQQAGLWLAAPLPIATGGVIPPPIIPEVNLYTDPRDGRSYAVVRFDSQLVWFTQDFEGVYDEGRVLPTPAPISSSLNIFTSADQRVHVVGLTAGGDVIMVFQFNVPVFLPTDIDNWGSVNLTTDHLEPQGQETPRFVSPLTTYVAPWNGLNIAGIDDAGRVHTVWWAPGLTLWQTSNLSDIASAPNFTGNVTSYVTPWSGLNVAGTTTDGKVATLWWVPQFGDEWKFDVLMPETPRGLAAGSLSAYVTPWGGLNVAGIDPETDKLAVYWWTPGAIWAYENILVEGGSPVIEGRVSAIATPPGQLDIFARGTSNELFRFYWDPGDGGVWTVEDAGARAL